MQDKNEQYTSIYSWMIGSLKLKGAALLVFAKIHSLCGESDSCKVSCSFLCKAFRLTKKTVITAVQRIQEAGYIKIKTSKTGNTYTLNREAIAKAREAHESKEEYFIQVWDWMICKGLKGPDLLVYALMFGFPKTHESGYYGSYSKIADKCGVNKSSVFRSIEELKKSGVITYIKCGAEIRSHGQETNLYTLNPEFIPDSAVIPKSKEKPMKGGENEQAESTNRSAVVEGHTAAKEERREVQRKAAAHTPPAQSGFSSGYRKQMQQPKDVALTNTHNYDLDAIRKAKENELMNGS